MAFSLSCALAQDTLKIITAIDQQVQDFNQYPDYQYQLFTLSNEDFLDTAFLNQPGKGYGQLTGYFRDGKLYKIYEMIGIKALHAVGVTTYYFDGGKLIYVYESEINGPNIFIDSEGTVDHKTDEPDFEIRYYFSTDRLIKSNEKGTRQTMLLPNEAFFDSMSKEGQLLYAAQQYSELLNKKMKK
jgi:hypothetical protein